MMQVQQKGSSYKDPQKTERVIGKKLPASVEAEKALLGALLLNDENVASVVEKLVPADFYIYQHRIIYEAILAISQRMERLDIVTLQNELEKRSAIESIGGVAYLLVLQEDIPSVGLVIQHAKIIKEKSVLRELINSATSII